MFLVASRIISFLRQLLFYGFWRPANEFVLNNCVVYLGAFTLLF